jgi:heterodisulfide reductase subunit B
LEVLGVSVKEAENWQCCGAVYPQAKDEIAARLSAVRALEAARREGCGVLTLCSACHHVFKQVNHDMQTQKDLQLRANNYMMLDEPYAGETKVVHYLELLRDQVGFSELKKKVANPLKGRKIGAYYGCLLLRPSGIMQFDDPENPKIMEDFIKALGAEPVIYPYRNECCGGYISLKEKDLAKSMSERIMDSAAGFGVETLITACPLCVYNLNKCNPGNSVEVVYFTDILATALGMEAKNE